MTTTEKGDANRRLVYTAIREFIHMHGYPPTIEDLCEMVGMTSKSSVHHHLVVLEEHGKIERKGRRNQWITLT